MCMSTETSCCLVTISHPKIEGEENTAQDYFSEQSRADDHETVVDQFQQISSSSIFQNKTFELL